MVALRQRVIINKFMMKQKREKKNGLRSYNQRRRRRAHNETCEIQNN